MTDVTDYIDIRECASCGGIATEVPERSGVADGAYIRHYRCKSMCREGGHRAITADGVKEFGPVFNGHTQLGRTKA